MKQTTEVEFYENFRGKSEVLEFIDGCSLEDRAKLENKITMVRSLTFDQSLEAGIVKIFGGKILELKPRGTGVRLLGFRTSSSAGDTLVLVSGFKKSIWKRKRKEKILKRASGFRDDWLRRQAEGR